MVWLFSTYMGSRSCIVELRQEMETKKYLKFESALSNKFHFSSSILLVLITHPQLSLLPTQLFVTWWNLFIFSCHLLFLLAYTFQLVSLLKRHTLSCFARMPPVGCLILPFRLILNLEINPHNLEIHFYCSSHINKSLIR